MFFVAARLAGGDFTHAYATVCASKPEADFWLDAGAIARVPEQAQGFFKIAEESTAPYIASGRFKTFTPDESPVAGVTTTLEAGHITAVGTHFQWVPVEYGPYQRAAHVPLAE